MGQSIVKIQAKLMRDYYKNFSKFAKGRAPAEKVAWVTSFVPVEILEALGIAYYYPESYAAVIAASGKEQPLLSRSAENDLCCDCCSYSCCIEGCLELEEGPRGVPPRPDILIATNNQCSTLPNWWNILAQRYNVPLIVLDYPGDRLDRQSAYNYVKGQHEELIRQMEELSGNTLDMQTLSQLIDNSVRSIEAWNRIVEAFPKYELAPTALFDDISFLITSRCKPETGELYELMVNDLCQTPREDDGKIPLFWLGYPLWYHPDRYLSELLDGFKVVGSNYITWWCLDYSGGDVFERLFNAYNYTFLNLDQQARNERLSACIKASGAVCAITLHNKSCKCDFVSARSIEIPQAEIEVDMIDRTFADESRTKELIALLRDTVCAG